MSKKVLVPIADGSEEIEAVTIIDVLRRAGADVTVASLERINITASRGVNLGGDCLMSDCKDDTYDAIVLPGGMPGAEHLRDCEVLAKMLIEQKQAGRIYAAICASPSVVFAAHGLIDDVKTTGYPGTEDKLPNAVDKSVVVDKNCITSKGPGTAMEFAVKLIEVLFDKDKADEIAKALLYNK